MDTDLARRLETLGPAERMVNAVLTYCDHLVHNRPGVVTRSASTPMGVDWAPVTHQRDTDGNVIVYRLENHQRRRLGFLREGRIIVDGDRLVGRYQPAGIFPEVAVYLYRQIAEIYHLDNEFVARWASYAFAGTHKDMKVVLCAFLLVQPRSGRPVVENGETLFFDEDYRSVGEAMALIRRNGFDPKLLLRVGEFLSLPEISAIHRELNFGLSDKRAFLGRWPSLVHDYLRHREDNPAMLEGLRKAGHKRNVVRLCEMTRYRPATERFFEVFGWRQKQAKDGRRSMAIGKTMANVDTWNGLDERQICERIASAQPKMDYKHILGKMPQGQPLTRAIIACAIENGAMSDADIIRYTPTLEDFGLLEHAPIKERLDRAISRADNARALNVAKNVKSQAVKEKLAEAADNANKKAVEEIAKGLVLYVFVDISSSMQAGIAVAIEYISRFLGGFPLDKLHVAVFNTTGRVLAIKHASKKGVEAAFRGIAASGGTDYGAGPRAISALRPGLDEDALFLFVGDNDPDNAFKSFAASVRASGVQPMAMGLVYVPSRSDGRVVDVTAGELGIPCVRIDEKVFADPYAIPRTLRNLVHATPTIAANAPVRPVASTRKSLVQSILETKLLEKPRWATV